MQRMGVAGRASPRGYNACLMRTEPTTWEPVFEPWHGLAPEQAAIALRGRPGLVWLDSALADPLRGRWSILASDPRWTLTARRNEVVLDDATGTRALGHGALAAFASAVEAEPRPSAVHHAVHPNLPFYGGAIGYLGYEVGREVERLPATTRDDVGAPDLTFGWYDAALVWDAAVGHGWLVGRPAAVEALRRHLDHANPVAPVPARAVGDLRANMSPRAYLEAVVRAKRYIAAGDIYQVNLSQRFSAEVAGEGLELYRQLRAVSPASFAAYLDFRHAGGVEVLSSSPERFLLADGRDLETRPIKGTRPRGVTPADDLALADALRGSKKDRAEHLMIVDLERNDLGRVATPGSVRVPAFAALESFAQVHHLTSTVTARRREGVGLETLLCATFPGGSITGAPKIRAMEIIDELEPTVRGVYTGAIGYVSAHGRLDLNIAIRTITLADGVAHVHVGGAIVHDSDPEAEYAETLAKARGMARALGATLPDEGTTSAASALAVAAGVPSA